MVYVMSDLHGQSDAFFDILEQINFSDNDELYILGDIIDRGPDAFKIYDYIVSHKNVHLLKGNHEQMMLDFVNLNAGDIVENPTVYHSRNLRFAYLIWMQNGGNITYEQLIKFSKTKRQKIFNTLKKCKYYEKIEVNGQKYILCHGTPTFYELSGVENPTIDDMLNALIIAPEYEILWGRDCYPQEVPFGYKVIHGHTPVHHLWNTDSIKQYSNGDFINVDCGCASGKRLACLRLDDMQEFYSEKMI